MNRVQTFLFMGSLSLAFLLGACGAGDDCDAFCDKAESCGDPRGECMEFCEALEPPAEFIECSVELSCTPSEEDVQACARSVDPSAACVEFCSSGCVEMDPTTCASSCTVSYPAPVQACLASLDDECGGYFDCFEGYEQFEY